MRVLLIDDHALFRAGLTELLERRGIKVVASAAGCGDGLQWAEQARPEVILLDLRMPGVSGLEVLQRLRAAGHKMPIAVLTTSRDEQDVIAALQGGSQGYLLKDMEPDELIRALKHITNGEIVVAPELTGILARFIRGGATAAHAYISNHSEQNQDTADELTPREMEILCLVVEGQSNKVIGRKLGISDGTVKTHVKAILRKLKVSSRVAAAVLAVEQCLCQRAGTILPTETCSYILQSD